MTTDRHLIFWALVVTVCMIGFMGALSVWHPGSTLDSALLHLGDLGMTLGGGLAGVAVGRSLASKVTTTNNPPDETTTVIEPK